MKIHTPFTYLIGWSKLNKWYYGVRFSKKCHPNDLWANYFTSSKHVKEFRKQNGEPDIIQIRKIFLNSDAAILWEHKVLKRLHIRNNDKWLNKTKGWENKEKANVNKLNFENIICPYCNKKSNTGNAKRWHFDRCKNNPNNKGVSKLTIRCKTTGKFIGEVKCM